MVSSPSIFTLCIIYMYVFLFGAGGGGGGGGVVPGCFQPRRMPVK